MCSWWLFLIQLRNSHQDPWGQASESGCWVSRWTSLKLKIGCMMLRCSNSNRTQALAPKQSTIMSVYIYIYIINTETSRYDLCLQKQKAFAWTQRQILSTHEDEFRMSCRYASTAAKCRRKIVIETTCENWARGDVLHLVQKSIQLSSKGTKFIQLSEGRKGMNFEPQQQSLKVLP